ncbi:MAG: nuclease-related domain-containing protein [Promethearchaeota archaeon]
MKEYFSKDEDTLIYFEPDIINLRPDFLILSPKFGIIVIEVKDYSPDHLRTIRKSGFWTEFVDCEEKPIDNPFEQIYNYWRAVKDKVNNCRFPEKISIPIILLVAFSNISEKNEIAKKISNYKPNFCLLERTSKVSKKIF